jgi:DNA primase
MDVRALLAKHNIPIKGTSGSEIQFHCPFHNDANASCYINQDKQVWNCFAGCGSGTLKNFEAKIRNVPEYIAEIFLRVYDGELPVISDETINLHARRLLENKEIVQKLFEYRGISEEIIKKHRLGLFDDRITIPLFIGEYCLNMKRWKVFREASDKDNKMLPYGKGYLSEVPFPQQTLSEKTILLTEGEGDCLTALSQGFPALTFGGTSVKIIRHAELLKSKRVYLCYDNDQPGRDAAAHNSNDLIQAGIQVYNVDIKLAGAEEGEDLTDLYVKDKEKFKEVFTACMETSIEGKASDSKPEAVLEVIDFKAFRNPKYHNRNVRIHAVLSGMEEQVKFVPKKIRIKCSKSEKKGCSICPAANLSEMCIFPSNQRLEEFIALYFSKQTSEADAIKDILRLKCKTFDYEVTEMQNLQVVFLTEPSKFFVKTASMEAYGFTSEQNLSVNRLYALSATITRNPRNQDAVIFIRSFDETRNTNVDWRTEKDDLKIFEVKYAFQQ